MSTPFSTVMNVRYQILQGIFHSMFQDTEGFPELPPHTIGQSGPAQGLPAGAVGGYWVVGKTLTPSSVLPQFPH